MKKDRVMYYTHVTVSTQKDLDQLTDFHET